MKLYVVTKIMKLGSTCGFSSP